MIKVITTLQNNNKKSEKRKYKESMYVMWNRWGGGGDDDINTLWKHPSQRDPEKGPSGSDPIPGRVKSDLEFGQLYADLTSDGVRLTKLWVIFHGKLTDYLVIVDPELSLTPMDLFRVTFDPSVF